jgi:two-component system CheB/CheR fusion protein
MNQPMSEETDKKPAAEEMLNDGADAEPCFPVVGIGASAGGLNALEKFFSHTPPDSGIAFVVIQHLSPSHKSLMPSLLAKYTEIPILEVADSMRVEPDRVYLNPPDRNVGIMNRVFHLLEPVRTDGINLPIDHFFSSLADDMQKQSAVIVLSGTASDGTLGIRTVKEKGGMVMVQSPESAAYDGMPRSAIDTGLADYVLPPEKLPGELIKYLHHPYIKGLGKAEENESEYQNEVRKIFALIRKRTEHDFSHYKPTTIRRRIERRMAVHQLKRIQEYVRYLQQTPSETEVLFKDLLIGVTSFFRDPEAFDTLRKKVIPDLLSKKPSGSAIRVWVPGCSTGEEAYSLAVIFAEAMAELKEPFSLHVFASDIDADAIESARAGTYPESIAAYVSSERLSRFFIKNEDTYKIRKQIRESVIFAVQSLIKDPPFSKIDLISCRNLMIYMDAVVQKKIIPLFHYALNPGGILFLGTSETIGGFANLFSAMDAKWKIYQSKETPVRDDISHSQLSVYENFSGTRDIRERKMSSKKQDDLHATVEKIIIQDYAPPGILINSKYEILHFFGQTDKYLKNPTGRAVFNLMDMAREGLGYRLSNAIHRALNQREPVICNALQVRQHDNTFRDVDVTVRVLPELSFEDNLMLILFKDILPNPPREDADESGREKADPAVVRLEQELQSTREYLQTSNEELETSNEELRSMNEELQSLNEELQSTNEELETSKEEVQSSNEELITVNTELQSKVDELSQINSDINNLLASTEIGTVFLDMKFCIRRFTPAITKVFNLRDSDMGRPISDITSNLLDGDIRRDAEQVLRTLIPVNSEVRDQSGEWYSMKILPYRTIENVIDGVVVAFVENTRIKQAGELRRFKAVIQYSGDAIIVQDINGNILMWNKGAVQMYGRTAEEALNMNILEIIPPEDQAEFSVMIEKLKKGEVMRPSKCRRMTKDREILEVWGRFAMLPDDNGNPVEIASIERIEN